MKKSLLALAVLGAFTGVASAQSSVTLYGTLDVAGRYVQNSGQDRRYSLATGGLNSSQLGFRGVEDLGGGLKASFVLLAGMNAGSGNANGKFWNRRSTVSLSSNVGELRLGRDYTPTFWNLTLFDAFGTNGLGNSLNTAQRHPGTRQDNSIGYFLPSNIGGVYGQAMVAAGEGNNAGRYVGGRVGFAAGPFDVAVSYSQERVLSLGAGNQYKTFNVGGSYDFGFLKLMGYYSQEKIPTNKDQLFSISGVVPLGQGEVHAGFEQSKLDSNSNKVKKFALGYVYNLSKRTALYATGAIVDNGNASAVTLGSTAISGPNATGDWGGGIGSAAAAPTIGGKSKGFEAGIRHFF